MSFGNLTLFARIIGPLAASVLAYLFWRYIKNQGGSDVLLVVTYAGSRLGLWLLFALYMQHNVTSSDPRLYYTPMLERFLAGEVPIRDFFYPYGPFLILTMVPFYLLLGHSLAGISLFAIFAEGLALFFFIKCASLLEQRGDIERSWLRQALAVYLLNPATLYWTVLQGYHSIVQTAYAMGAFYFLLRGYSKTGYAIGLYSLAGSKFTAILDWPALLAVRRPRLTKLFWGAIPLLLSYAAFQRVSGDILFPVRFHINQTSEGNIWYFLTLFGDPRSFYSSFPGSLFPILFFGFFFLLGFGYWLNRLSLGLSFFSFQTAMGVATFTTCLFFLFSFYTGNYYVPMLMLPASWVVTSPGLSCRRAVGAMLLISAFCVAGDAIWTSMNKPDVLLDAFSSGPVSQKLLAGFWTASLLARIVCFVILAQFGMITAIGGTSSKSMPVGASYAVR